MKTFIAIAAALFLVTGCSSPAQSPDPSPQVDAGPAACYPSEPGVRLACETGCGEMLRVYQRSGGADAGLYFDYSACLNECGCNEWPDAAPPSNEDAGACVPMLWVNTQFYPCDVACAGVGDGGEQDVQTCENSCSCVVPN